MSLLVCFLFGSCSVFQTPIIHFRSISHFQLNTSFSQLFVPLVLLHISLCTCVTGSFVHILRSVIAASKVSFIQRTPNGLVLSAVPGSEETSGNKTEKCLCPCELDILLRDISSFY